MSIKEAALKFFDACETGKGWDTCKEWCHEGATFSCQADALAEITTLEAYTGWTAGILVPVPDGRYELKSVSVDEERGSVSAFSVFHGTQTGDGGPVPPTGNTIATNYVGRSKRCHFGLGGAERIDELTVHWPSGAVTRMNNVAADRVLSIVEPSG